MASDKTDIVHQYKMDTSHILDLLKTEIRREEGIRSSINTTMSIYVTMLIAILGGLATLVSKTYESFDHKPLGLFLILGGLIVIFVALAALKHYVSGYRRQAESIVQEAKLKILQL